MSKDNLISVTSGNIHLKYSYSSYALCCGNIEVQIIPLNKTYTSIFLCSGGGIICPEGEEWNLQPSSGPWDVTFCDDFPEEYKDEVVTLINAEIPWGCCGGCI